MTVEQAEAGRMKHERRVTMKKPINWSILVLVSLLGLVSGMSVAIEAAQGARQKAKPPVAQAADGWLGMHVGSTIPGYRILEVAPYPEIWEQSGAPTMSVALDLTEWKAKLQQHGCIAIVNLRMVVALGDLSEFVEEGGVRTLSPGKEAYVYGDCVLRAIPE
jgi:hypothetical protein